MGVKRCVPTRNHSQVENHGRMLKRLHSKEVDELVREHKLRRKQQKGDASEEDGSAGSKSEGGEGDESENDA